MTLKETSGSVVERQELLENINASEEKKYNSEQLAAKKIVDVLKHVCFRVHLLVRSVHIKEDEKINSGSPLVDRYPQVITKRSGIDDAMAKMRLKEGSLRLEDLGFSSNQTHDYNSVLQLESELKQILSVLFGREVTLDDFISISEEYDNFIAIIAAYIEKLEPEIKKAIIIRFLYDNVAFSGLQHRQIVDKSELNIDQEKQRLRWKRFDNDFSQREVNFREGEIDELSRTVKNVNSWLRFCFDAIIENEQEIEDSRRGVFTLMYKLEIILYQVQLAVVHTEVNALLKRLEGSNEPISLEEAEKALKYLWDNYRTAIESSSYGLYQCGDIKVLVDKIHDAEGMIKIMQLERDIDSFIDDIESGQNLGNFDERLSDIETRYNRCVSTQYIINIPYDEEKHGLGTKIQQIREMIGLKEEA